MSDISALTSLTLHDVDPTVLAERGRQDLTAKVPGLLLLVGQVETVLIDVFALIAAETVYAINRVPASVVGEILNRMGAVQDPGAVPTVTVTFTLSVTTPTLIPEGTVLRLNGTASSILFLTDADVTSTNGSNTVLVGATATATVSEWNGTPSGTRLEVLSVLPVVEGAVTATSVISGRDPEDRNAWLERAGHRLARLTSALVTADSFADFALERPGVSRAMAVGSYDADNDVDSLGHVTVAVAGPDGFLFDADTKTALRDDMSALGLANLAVHVIDPTITAVDIVVSVRKQAFIDQTQVQGSIQTALAAFLDPDTWPWSGTVFRSEIIAEINRAGGVQSVEALTEPAADIVLPGLAPLVQLGEVTINFV